jgi:hypothetical protein
VIVDTPGANTYLPLPGFAPKKQPAQAGQAGQAQQQAGTGQ